MRRDLAKRAIPLTGLARPPYKQPLKCRFRSRQTSLTAFPCSEDVYSQNVNICQLILSLNRWLELLWSLLGLLSYSSSLCWWKIWLKEYSAQNSKTVYEIFRLSSVTQGRRMLKVSNVWLWQRAVWIRKCNIFDWFISGRIFPLKTLVRYFTLTDLKLGQ